MADKIPRYRVEYQVDQPDGSVCGKDNDEHPIRTSHVGCRESCSLWQELFPDAWFASAVHAATQRKTPPSSRPSARVRPIPSCQPVLTGGLPWIKADKLDESALQDGCDEHLVSWTASEGGVIFVGNGSGVIHGRRHGEMNVASNSESWIGRSLQSRCIAVFEGRTREAGQLWVSIAWYVPSGGRGGYVPPLCSKHLIFSIYRRRFPGSFGQLDGMVGDRAGRHRHRAGVGEDWRCIRILTVASGGPHTQCHDAGDQKKKREREKASRDSLLGANKNSSNSHSQVSKRRAREEPWEP
ncbi:hypothetical protein B0J13DRAFT_523388 [Dactylonectria estremocensis]|uniref:Uncharacterized protein n=1 Tax=Dactylonectria estremocensis TaxID=1079267 RepID=A0A9P9EYV4_9HYPO|nr:hypothetical protein B0J13DRAFT_523388 [Dactylonectria estremocensis]